MDKLDARMQSLFGRSSREAHATSHKDLASGTAQLDTEPREMVDVFVEFTGNPAELIALGLKHSSIVKHPDGYRIAAGRLPLDRVLDVAALPHVKRIEYAEHWVPELDHSRQSVGAGSLYFEAPPVRGQGVVVGVIDVEIDFRHPSLRNPDGTTRFYSIWVQDRQPQKKGEAGAVDFPELGDKWKGEVGPVDFPDPKMGTEWDENVINAALVRAYRNKWEHSPDTDPINDMGVLSGTKKKQGYLGHGTYVMGIAAGNGAAKEWDPPYKYIGIAPEAKLVFVKYKDEDLDYGSSVNLVNAVEYIFNRADVLGLPCVINMSLGGNLGPHDGTGSAERWFDAIVAAKSGRVLVKSAGNEADTKRHTFQRLEGGASVTLEMSLDRPCEKYIALDLWYPGGQALGVKVIPPPLWEGQSSSLVKPGDPPLIDWPVNPKAGPLEDVRVYIIHELNTNNGANRVLVLIRSQENPPDSWAIPSGTWEVFVQNLSQTASTEFHGWIEKGGPVFPERQASPECTITAPGTARSIVTVGAYDDRWISKGALVSFSSRGPIRTSVERIRLKPELVAPGVAITSARSEVNISPDPCCDCLQKYYISSNTGGTSAAAPHVAGVVALMLQVNPTLTAEKVREYLKETAHMADNPDANWGYGKVRALAAVNKARGQSSLSSDTSAETDGMSTTLVEDGTPGIGSDSGFRGDRSMSTSMDAPSAASASLGVWQRLREVQRELLSTSGGAAFAALVSIHVDEVRRLVNTNRRVTVAWHRNGGPTLVRAAMACLYDPDLPFPSYINEAPTTECVGRIVDELAIHSSPALADAIRCYRDILTGLGGASLNGFMARLHAT